ncbi:MAG: HEAT repeat domain-containing protein [Myxococcota bacterium]
MSTTGGPEVLPDFYKDELERDQIASLLRQRRLTANEIVEGLWHGQVKVRRNAARGLQLLQDPPAPGEVMLRISAKDADEKVRAEIIGACAMGVGGTAVAVPILFDALMDKGEGIRDTALQGLERRITQKATEVVPYYVSAMSDVRPLVSSVAVRFLIQAGGMLAVGALVPMLGDQDPRLRRAAFDVLDRLKWQAVGPLIEALRDPNARELAVKLLSGLGTVDKKHMQALEALLANATSSGDEGLRVACEKVQAEISRVVEPPRTAPLDIPIADFMQRALSDDELPADSDVALDEVLHALRDGRAHVRQNAAAWLGRLSSAQEKADLVLLKLAPVVRDGDVGVRVQVARALASFGGARPSRLLVTALGDPQADVRQAALQALVALGPDGLAGALDAVGTETPRPARTGIEHAAARLGTATVPVLADVLVAGAGMSAVAREVAANALGSLGKAAEEGISALLGALLDPLEDVRAAAAQALGFVGVNDEAVMAALGRCLKDPVANVRRQAALAASRITGKPLDDRSAAEPRPIPVPGFETEVLDRQHIAEARGDVPVGDFVRALRDGRDIVKRNAATAIGSFGEAGGAGAAPMAILLRDGDVEVRRAAVEAYLALGKAALPAAWFLTAALNDPDAGVKDGVIDVLVALHPEAADFLIEALRTDLEVARKGVFNVWYRLGHAGVPDLGRATQSSSGLIRVNACWALEMLARRGADAAQGELEARLGDVIGKVRVAAQAALDAIGGGKPQPPKVLEPDPVAIPDFDATLLDAGRIAPHLGEVTVERMVRALRDGRPFVRANAVTALGLFAADGAADAAADAIGALGSIAVAARDSAIEVRRAACEALAQLARAAAASRPDDAQGTAKTAAFLLVTALEDRADKVREAARAGLTGLGASALPALVEGLLRPADVAKHSVMPVFAALGAAALPALRAALDADSPLLRAGALRALRVIGREHATLAKADVERLKASSDDQVRAEASGTLDHIEGRDVLPVALSPLPIPAEMQVVILPPETVRQLTAGMDADLLLKATHDGREVVRANAARALGFVQNPPKRVAGGLAILLRAPEPAVREAAVEALQELGPKHAAPAAFFLAVALDEPEARHQGPHDDGPGEPARRAA